VFWLTCGHGHEAVFAGYRDRFLDTVLGLVTLSRAWYHCRKCERGLASWDDRLGVAGMSLSSGLAAMTDRAAAAMPFARAAALLEDLAGVRFTAKQAERTPSSPYAALRPAAPWESVCNQADTQTRTA
jgi:hypothetical protein